MKLVLMNEQHCRLTHVQVRDVSLFQYACPSTCDFIQLCTCITVKTLNIGTSKLTTVVVLNIKQFNFTMK